MLISRLTLKAFLGISDASFPCGRITEIQGGNGSGKTSAIEGLKASIMGGSLVDFRRVGSTDEPETLLEIDEGVLLVERSIKSNATETVVSERIGDTAARRDKKKPQTFLETLFDTELVNPLVILAAPRNKQADLLLEVLAPELDEQALAAAIGAELWPTVAPIIHAGGHPLNLLNTVRSTLYAARTGVNGAKEDKARTVHELRPNIPAHLPAETESVLPALEQERDGLADKVAQARAAAESEASRIVMEAEAAFESADGAIVAGFKTEANKVRTQEGDRVRAAEADAEQKINAIRQALAEDKAREKENADTRVAALREAADVERKRADAVLTRARVTATAERARLLEAVEVDQARFTTLAATIATQRAEAERLITVRSQKELADRLEAEAKALAGKSERLTAAITAVDVFKADLLNGFPIEGLTVENREIKIDGIPFAQVNTAKRIAIAVQIAALRARKKALPVLFIDGAEALDDQNYEILLRELEASGCQAFVASVSRGPLTVKARESVAQAS